MIISDRTSDIEIAQVRKSLDRSFEKNRLNLRVYFLTFLRGMQTITKEYSSFYRSNVGYMKGRCELKRLLLSIAASLPTVLFSFYSVQFY